MKKIVWLLGLFCIFFVLISCGGRPYGGRFVTLYENDGSTEEIVLENEYLEMRFLPETTEVVVTDKATGVQWRSNPAGEDPLADTVTRYMMRSLFTLEYADITGVGQTLYSSEQSVNFGAYMYEVVDGGLEVSYTVGHLERTYIVPPAVPEERMQEILEGAEQSDRSIVLSIYRLYDINNLRQGDDRAELLATYPDLARRKIYVMRTETREFQKVEAEIIFTNAGYTYDEFIEDIARYPAVSSKESPSFNLTLRYTLDGRSFVVDVPFDKIAYRQSYPVTRLTLLPYMGAGSLNDEGYLLVPDGSGALIYFNNGRHNQLTYGNFVYGWDEGRIREAVVNDNRAPFPVFGVNKNGAALLCIIENGASYANVRADVAGRNSSWNNVHSRFSMVHGERMDISGRSERAVYLYERSLPVGESITLRYIVCDRDGYVGMAHEYRSWLLNRYPSLASKKQENSVPIAVEIPGAVNKTQHIIGIPFDLPLRLTSYKEMTGMVNDFADFGWKNVRVKLNGWFNRSVEHTIPTRIKLINRLGSKKDFNNLVNTANQKNYALYPEVDFFFMKDKKPFDGFSLYRDAARFINRERIQRYPYSFVWFGERHLWGKLSYIARPEKMMSMIDDFVDMALDLDIDNFAFRNMGSRLTGDYNERQHVSREESMRMRQIQLNEMYNSKNGVMLLAGHAYAMPWADFIVDMALEDQNFGITDVSVPFYPIVLSGLVPYTGRAINLAEDYTVNLLKTIESGAGLYFSFMIEETAVLQETKFRQFYANEYHKWAGDANALYQRFSVDFAGLYNQAIADHIILEPDVTMTEYSDGTRVIVNYRTNAWTYRGISGDDFQGGSIITVQPKSYVVLR